MDQGHDESRIGAIGAVSGAVLLAVGTYLYPLKADPNDAPGRLVSMQPITFG
jgi:hypothetical protein